MIVLSIVATLAAVIWTLFVAFANGMSDAPSARFQGGGTIIAAWVAAVVFWLAWWAS